MKKIVYILIGFALIGGISFGLSQSKLLKGRFDFDTPKAEEGPLYIRLNVQDSDGEFISGLTFDNFELNSFTGSSALFLGEDSDNDFYSYKVSDSGRYGITINVDSYDEFSDVYRGVKSDSTVTNVVTLNRTSTSSSTDTEVDSEGTIDPELEALLNLAYKYMQLAEQYAEEACDEAAEALSARQAGDYKGFEEHMNNANQASQNANSSATASQSAYYSAQELLAQSDSKGDSNSETVETFAGTKPLTAGGLYTEWTEEDLFGYYTDLTLGTETLINDWDYKIYEDPDEFIKTATYELEVTNEYIDEIASKYYENILSSEDLIQYNKDINYQTFLNTVYADAYTSTPAYAEVITEAYTQDFLKFKSYQTRF